MVSTPSPSSGGIFIVFGFPRPTSWNQNLLQSIGNPITNSRHGLHTMIHVRQKIKCGLLEEQA